MGLVYTVVFPICILNKSLKLINLLSISALHKQDFRIKHETKIIVDAFVAFDNLAFNLYLALQC